MWIAFSVLTAFLATIVNYLDKYLLDKVVKDRSVGVLILFSSLIGIPVSIVIYLFFCSEIISSYDTRNALFLILGGVLYLIAVLLYLKALQTQDASSFVPQTMLLPAVSGVLSYIFLKETVSFVQIVGGLILTVSALKLNDQSGVKAVWYVKYKNFIYALGICTLSSLNIVLFKLFTVNEGSFWESIFWNQVGFSAFGILTFLIVGNYRNDFLKIFKTNGFWIIGINLTGEVINLIWAFTLQYASLIGPVFIVSAISEGLQPFMLLIVGFLLTKLLPKYIQEDISKEVIKNKLILFCLMALGLCLMYLA